MKAQFGRRPRSVLLVAAVLMGSAFVLAIARDQAAAGHGQGGIPRIVVLSNRADLISGGDALVRVILPGRVDPARVSVELNGSDITSDFAVRSNGSYEGLVTGLSLGTNRLIARMPKAPDVGITITNHPIGGPIIAGPQVQPWICRNVQNGLAPPTDAQCNSPTAYSFVYMSTATHQFTPYDPAHPPAAGLVATTTTDQGVTVPYIVRIERGTEDRGIYDVAVLDDPSASWAPWASQSGWNHKVVWAFGASTAPHHSNGPPQPVLVSLALSRGFMVANSSLNTRGQNANDTVSAEAMLMLKEHIAETYGRIRYTMGTGCSGGSIEQYVLAADYPGLVDGIMPNCSYQDSATTSNEVADCNLVTHYFNASAPGTFTAAQQAAVEDEQDGSVCFWWDQTFASVNTPSLASNCDMTTPPYLAMVYNPLTNPTGTRCTLQDYQQAIWGLRPPSVWGPVEQHIQHGFAKRPLDNVGVQYGLEALNRGVITAEQFVALNQRVGGLDIDNNFQAERMVADPGSVRIAYRTGQVTNGRELANVPIIDLRGSHNVNDIHSDYHSYVMRARLEAANGNHDNQIIWTWAGGPGLFQNITPGPDVAAKSFLLMDRWLSSIEADGSRAPLSVKVRRDKPADAVDACFTGPYGASTEVTDKATCAALFPYYGDPRLGAGGPLADEVMKCRLKPLDPADYDVTFTADQWARLQQAFPDGACDWTRPGVDEQPSLSWMTFTNGPGGEPLGRPPRSRPVPPH
jgi:Tannase-like family of unknown function (DUF6351)